MKTLGISTSHDPSIAIVEDGVLLHYWDESRFQRNKYFMYGSSQFGNHVQYVSEALRRNTDKLEFVESVAFCSFDKRQFLSQDPESEGGILITDNFGTVKESRQFLEILKEDVLSMKQITNLRSLYPKNITLPKETGWQDPKADSYEWDQIVNSLPPNTSVPHVNIDFDYGRHHIHHAETGYYFSPFKKSGEDAVAIVWDGGGAKSLHDKGYPDFMEQESIYRLTPEEDPDLQWQHLSNQRTVSGLMIPFVDGHANGLDFASKLEIKIDGVQYIFDSRMSSGQRYSMFSSLLGFDNEGRAAGSVMGFAAYGSIDRPAETYQDLSAQLQEDTFIHSCGIIDKAIELNPTCKNIVLSGGYSLNCVNNYRFLETYPDHQFFVDPVANDSGTSIGVALMSNRKTRKGGTNG